MTHDLPESEKQFDPLDQIREWQQKLAELPEPVAYIVLDHGWSPVLPHVDGHDAKGRRYVLLSPAVLDETRFLKDAPPSPYFGIPVYKRESMPEGWPDA